MNMPLHCDEPATGYQHLPSRSVWGVIGCVSVLSAALIACWLASLPVRHRAALQLEFQPAFRPGAELSSAESLNTQAVILASRGICERALERLQLQQPQRPRSGDGAKARQDVICDRLSATRIPGTHLVEIAYEDEDSKRSLSVVSEVAEAYLEHVTSLSEVESQLLVRLKRELDSREAELTENQRSVVGHAIALGVADPGARQAALAAELKTFDEALTAARITRIRRAARVSALAQTPPSGDTGPSNEDDGVKEGAVGGASVLPKQILDAKAELRAAELEEAELQRTIERTHVQALSLLEQEPERERLERSRRIYAALHAAALRRIEEAASAAGTPWRTRLLTPAHLVSGRNSDPMKWFIPVVPLLGAVYALARLWGMRRQALNRYDSRGPGQQQRAEARLSGEVPRA